MGIDPIKDGQGHDIRTMSFVESKVSKGFVCLGCMNVWKQEDLIGEKTVAGTQVEGKGLESNLGSEETGSV